MRTFLALEIEPAIQHQISTWRSHTLPPVGKAVDPTNFHITLAFLGDTNEQTLESLCFGCDRVAIRSFELHIDTTGYFPRSGVYWIGPYEVPEALESLHKNLRKTCRKAGIKIDKRRYHPHLTLFRKCSARPPLPTEVPRFLLDFNGFALFQSTTGAKGVNYRILHRW